MAEDDGTIGGTNPYQRETTFNTRTDWLDDQKPLDVDLDGLVDYAKNMTTIQQNLQGRTGRLNDLGSLPSTAWEAALPEAMYLSKQISANYSEFVQYLGHLGTALTNIGMAAQTVADAYSSTDGWSAASLDAVRWAFGDADAPRPGGLPPWVTGKTYWDQRFEAMANGETTASGSGQGNFTDAGQRVNADGSTTFLSVNPNGERMEVTERSLPGGLGTVSTVVVYAADGTVLSRQSSETTTVVKGASRTQVTVSYDGDGKRISETRETTTYGTCNADGTTSQTVTTEERDASGDLTSRTVDEVNPDGSQTITTTDGDGRTVEEVHVGQNTAGVTPQEVSESPAKRAQDEIRQHDYGP